MAEIKPRSFHCEPQNARLFGRDDSPLHFFLYLFLSFLYIYYFEILTFKNKKY